MPSHNHTFNGSAASNGSHGHTATLNLSGLTTSSSGDHTHIISDKVVYGYPQYGEQQTVVGNGPISAYRGTASTNIGGAHTHSISGSGSVTVAAGGAHTHTVSGTVGNTGSGQAHENRPPYYALCYIMKL